MKKRILIISLSFLAFSACEKTEVVAPVTTQPAVSANETITEPGNKKTAAVTAEGTRFDPPLGEDEVPDQAWMCSMGGKVHYARSEEGDGKCAVCGMTLQQKGGGEHEGMHEHE